MSTVKDTESMSRTRLYSAAPIDDKSAIELSGDQARYIGRVLRLRPHDEITLFDGSGAEYRAIVVSISKSAVDLSITAGVERNVESPFQIHLLQGISRGERMDFVVQKATELGVTQITPILMEHSVVKLDPKRAEKRLQHWCGVASSACEQCGRNVLPVINEATALRDWLGRNHDNPGTRVILRPGSEDSFKSMPDVKDEVTLLIGPEGGFSEAEYELAEITGFRPVGFGPRVLRTETAALAAIAALQTLYGDLAAR
jgi:16S rRNA (uracil1498-N3)-methyltransferase